jgi:hypothetical protein
MTQPRPLPATERLRELLEYDAETGTLMWAVRRGRHQPGTRAGSLNGLGYRQVVVDGHAYVAHRLIWRMVTGDDPGPMQVDHINLDKDDNRIANLRLATPAQNTHNSRAKRQGLKGVKPNATGFQARITVLGTPLHLGQYPTEQEANDAYAKAAVITYGQYARAA